MEPTRNEVPLEEARRLVGLLARWLTSAKAATQFVGPTTNLAVEALNNEPDGGDRYVGTLSRVVAPIRHAGSARLAERRLVGAFR